MAKHTPGPWSKGRGADCHLIYPNIGEVYGSTRGCKPNPRHEESQANARLIAAAPDLLEAALNVEREFKENPYGLKTIAALVSLSLAIDKTGFRNS